ncbi:uncharacterized protein [Narcine bancroftii]|uniref:uncharacterized protein isoform X2 n=1 Tax=Narcine bancroftii TaxID=1343680 RepID=UPI0038311175
MKRQKGKKKGPTKEKVFGCDLGTHLEGTGQDVPQVLKQCAEFIEEHGIVDGIYRLSGISSNIQKLRQEFDTEKTVDLCKDVYLQDIHCVSSLCKAYFRELPNPLLVYQLYDKFADAVNTQMEADRLMKIRQVLQELPPSHYRSKEIETSGFNGTAAFMEVRVQSIVVEFILNHVHQLFSSSDHFSQHDGDTERCQSLPCLSPRMEQLTGRTHPSQIPHILHLGDGPPAMKPYHTIIELPDNRRKGSLKAKKWRSIFNLGRSGNDSKRKLCRNEGKDLKTSSLTLRPAKSMDSLSSAPFTSDASALTQEISWELQDTFSFLDSQDMTELGDAEMQEDFGRPLRTPEEMDPSESLPAFEHEALRLDMSIESQLMELDEGRQLAYRTQLHLWEFSVEPPCEDEWELDQVHPLCPMPSPPPLNVPKPRDPTPSSPESGKRCYTSAGDITGQEDSNAVTGTEGCSTTGGVTGQEDPSAVTGTEGCSTTGVVTGQEDSSAVTGTEGCSTTGGVTGQEDHSAVTGTEGCSTTGVVTGKGDPSAVTGTEGCSTTGGVTGQEDSSAVTGTEGCSTTGVVTGKRDPSAVTGTEGYSTTGVVTGKGDPSAVTGTEGCLSTGGVTGKEDPSAVIGTEGCSTIEGVLEVGDTLAESRGSENCWAQGNLEGEPGEGLEEDLGAQGKMPGEGPLLTAVPMLLKSSVLQYHHSRALPVVPPKPHYALLPPALKGRPRPPAPGEHRPLTPSPRSLAWRKKGSQSFDEVVARRREQQWVDLAQPRTQAQSRALLRGDSLPCPRDRLSLPAPVDLPPAQTRCRSLALEGEDSG